LCTRIYTTFRCHCHVFPIDCTKSFLVRPCNKCVKILLKFVQTRFFSHMAVCSYLQINKRVYSTRSDVSYLLKKTDKCMMEASYQDTATSGVQRRRALKERRSRVELVCLARVTDEDDKNWRSFALRWFADEGVSLNTCRSCWSRLHGHASPRITRTQCNVRNGTKNRDYIVFRKKNRTPNRCWFKAIKSMKISAQVFINNRLVLVKLSHRVL